jgi:hypothetical protein
MAPWRWWPQQTRPDVEDAANRPALDGGLLALGGGVPHKRQGCGSLGFREEAAALQGRAREGM